MFYKRVLVRKEKTLIPSFGHKSAGKGLEKKGIKTRILKK
jgi:hypothetical protein